MKRWTVAGVCLSLGLAACRPADSEALEVRLTTQPAALQVGTAWIDLQFPKGPAEAAVSLEGNMTHAGMVPVRADAQRIAPNRYRVEAFPLTMAGDWILTVTATTQDGSVQSTDVPIVVEGQ